MRTECPKCNSKFNAPESYIGKQASCPQCKESFLVRKIEETEQVINTENERLSTKMVDVNCGNCGLQIGKLEKKYKWKDYIVCELCFLKLKPAVERDCHDVGMKKPGKFSTIAGVRMGAGICDILAGLVFCWLVFPIVMIPFGIIEIISACNLLKEKPEYPKSIKTIAILEIIGIVTLAGWISIVAGIMTLVFLSDDKVKAYIESLREKDATD